MTRRLWPDTLPGVIVPGYRLRPVDSAIRTEMDAGLTRNRRISAARSDVVTAAWKFTDTEMELFRAWHGDESWSLAGASDDITGWTPALATVAPDTVPGPAGQLADTIVESLDTGQHHIRYHMPGVVSNQPLRVTASLAAAGRSAARLSLIDRANTLCWANIDLTDGTVLAQNGVDDVGVTARGGGWFRAWIAASSGWGTENARVRIQVLGPSAVAGYAGDGASGVAVCEVNARVRTGHDLFLATDAAGNVRGAAGGSAWVEMPLFLGGGEKIVEARFRGPFDASVLPGLGWQVTAQLEVRNA